MNFSRSFIWRKLRERKILASHKKTAKICKDLIRQYQESPVEYRFEPKKQFNTDRIIWQYWAQGYDSVPDVISNCLKSVDEFAKGYIIVRLTDENLVDYIDLPPFVKEKRNVYSRAFFSDLLRLILLRTYGGIWLDATILLTGPIPEELANQPFFVYRRDPNEPNYKYWRNTYAYYFGWAKGFRVNMLSSFMVAKKEDKTVSDLCNYLLFWWELNDYLPDYFFLMILFDVYHCTEKFPLISDCIPHLLQQSINDPRFKLVTREKISQLTSIHKLTYK